ncbi:MAG: GEVED domain-containing protein, partial [Ferruginibacter sp.]
MIKCYASKFKGVFFFFLMLLSGVTALQAQTTLSTVPNPPYDGANGAGTNQAVTFVIENTNAFPVLLNGVSTWINTTDANGTYQLWYSATSLSGLPAIAAPTWTMINQVTNFPAPATSGITPVWTSLGFTIPAGTQYRFAVWYVTTASHYSGAGAGTVTPNTFSGGGVNLKVGDVQIAGSYVGYGGANNPRFWTGGIIFAPAGPCVNPPIAGTATASSNPTCSGAGFNVSLTGGTGGTGQTYQWQSSPDGTVWTNIAGATNATLSTSQTANTYYRAIVTCGGASSTSTAVLVTTTICYCTSIPTSTVDEEIFSVTVNGATNAFDCSTVATGPGSILNRYSNFYPLGALTNILPGATVSFTILEDECDGPTYFSNGCSIWIDFNRDGDFLDAGEQVYVEATTTQSPRTITGTFTVPLGAVAGLTGMRIIVAENNSGAQLQPCMTYTYGETEDYLVNILSLVPCAGTPVAGTASSTKANACFGESFTLNSNGSTAASGITYQWQSSPDGIIWTNIAGATNLSYTTSQSASTYYRLVVTCTNGGATATTNAVQVFTPTLVSGTFTINSAVATGGTNFQSFNDAYDYIKCGIAGPVIFNVNAASGPYTEQLIMTEVPGASATNTVTFNGNGRTLQYLSTNTNERAVIKLNGADHIRFDNLVISALGITATQYGFGVHLTNNADSNAVTNSIINITDASTSTNYAGIVLSASNTSATGTGSTLSDGNVFMGNTINGGYYGFTSVGSTTAANRDNVFKNNTVLDYYSYGTYISGNFSTLVDSNTYSRPTRTTVTTHYGVYVTSLNVSLKINRNTFKDPFGGAPTSTSTYYGIYFTGVDALSGLENKAINNKFYNFSGAGEVNALYNISSDNVWYQHNTILLDGAGGTGTQLTRGFYQTTLAAGIRLENNIIMITRTSSGAKYCLYFNTATSDIVSNYNDLYFSPTAVNAFTGFLGSARLTLADWRAASLQDANSVANDPLFVDVTTGNLKPTNASINDLGTPLGVPIDILGVARSLTTPDMGAYEFTPGNCTSPPTPGIAVATPNVVCINTLVSLGVSGNSIGLGQTYQWQFAATAGGPYTNFGTSITNPAITITASVTRYYRVAVTCGGATTFSAPVLLTVNPAFPGGTYTINKTLPTAGTNYTSFADAYQALSCGIAGPVIFNVASGTGPYTEQLVMDSIAGTSATNTVTFNGNGNTLAFSSSVTGERAVIKLRGADHIIFDSLVINANGPNLYGWGVELFNDADSNVIRNCTILTDNTSTSTNYAGIVLSNSETSATGTGNSLCDGNLFQNNTINGGYYGITIVGGTTTTTIQAMNNKAIGNDITGFYFYGIYVAGTQNTEVTGNKISRPTRTTTSSFNGVYVNSINLNTLINKNRITNPFGGNLTSTSIFYGIYLTGVDAAIGQETHVQNNVIYGTNGNGTKYGFYNSSSSNVNYYHNTISFDEVSNTSSNTTYGFYQITLADNINFKNNLIYIVRGGTGNKVALYFATTTSTITSNYNDLYVTGTNAYTGYDGTLRTTLPIWRAASGQDLNSFALDPFFANLAGGNLTPMSPALDDKGTPVGVLTDIINTTRSTTTPDIGAYEFTIPPCSVPPVAGNAVANPNTAICLGASIDLTLDNNSFGSGQTYQWQYSTTTTGPWINLGGLRQFPDTTIIASGSYYYRVLVTCGGQTAISGLAQVTLNAAFLAGTYTINKTIPVSATNFTSFVSAVAALDCGITGPVFFDVNPDTYTEQVRMHYVAGTSPTVRVTFRSANGNPSAVILTNNATVAANNYTLLLDSSKYITWKNMTINATNATNGRVVELRNSASFDSLVNLRINAPVSTSTANTSAGIFANGLLGEGNVVKQNIISNGSSGVYFAGTNINSLSYDNVFDSNTVNGSFYYNMYFGFNGRIKVSNNTVNVTMPSNTTHYGMYSTSSDSSYQYFGNMVNITGMTVTTYGMYFTGCNGGVGNGSRIAGNTIMATTGNTGTLYGMYQTASTYNNTINNVISVNSTGATVYGAYMTGGGGCAFQNNTVVNSAAGTGTGNIAAYLTQTSGTQPSLNIQNNILSHLGGGAAFFTTNLNFIYSDYNTFWSAGTTLIRWNANAYPTLKAWRDTSYWDLSSISILPALLSTTDLRPNLLDPNVWAIHGRGNQIPGNDYDFNNNPRPTTLTAGVPDMGAYEFLPTSQPTILTGIPAVATAGGSQYFMYGTDTVARVRYKVGAPVPTGVTLKRYSGVLPPGLAAGQLSMYFYTDFDVASQGAFNYSLEQFYVDSWQGFIPVERAIKLGRTNAAGNWLVNAGSKVDISDNIILDSALVYMDKFTGLTDGTVPPLPIVTYPVDSSNSGTRFWVGYGHHYSFSTNGQDMVLYLSAEQAATVDVKVNGTNYKRTYSVPANSAIVSVPIPKYGLIDARLTDEGKFDRGISIESNVPIQAYAHIYDGATSGASLLLPVGVYGYEYQSLNSNQYYPTGGAGSYSWFYVIADRDSTLLEIKPSVATKAGRPAGVPFQVYLNRGEVYNVMGTINGAQGTDLSGSTVKAIPNTAGKCNPFAMFSGSSRTAICYTTNGDNLIQQVFPSQAWGTRYLAFATANTLSNTQYNSNIFRVMVKDPATVVKKDGVVLPAASLQLPGKFYEFSTTQGAGPQSAVYIESDKPVMVGQYMVSTGATQCPGVTATGNGDPEMLYISPLEQGIKKAVFYNTDESAITANYVNVIVPTAGLTSLTIDGLTNFTDVFPHPDLPGYTCVRQNLSATPGQHRVICDSAFTSITYGLGSVESYGYNAGTLVKNLNGIPSFNNTLGSGSSPYTCV